MRLHVLSLITHEVYNCPVSYLEMQGTQRATSSRPMGLPPYIRPSRIQSRSDPIVRSAPCTATELEL